MITSLYILPLTLLLLYMFYRIIKYRRGLRIGIGDGGDVRLQQASRAHGNFIEVVPLALIIMVLLEMQGAPGWAVHLYGTVLVLSRIAHAQGMYQSAGESPGRMVGTIAILLLFIAGAAGLFALKLI